MGWRHSSHLPPSERPQTVLLLVVCDSGACWLKAKWRAAGTLYRPSCMLPILACTALNHPCLVFCLVPTSLHPSLSLSQVCRSSVSSFLRPSVAVPSRDLYPSRHWHSTIYAILCQLPTPSSRHPPVDPVCTLPPPTLPVLPPTSHVRRLTFCAACFASRPYTHVDLHLPAAPAPST